MIVASQMAKMRHGGKGSCSESDKQLSSPPRASIIAFSALQREDAQFLKLKSATESGRILLSDRKGWFDHLTTANLVKSSIRVAAVQSSNMVANYLQDQLQADFQREELVKEGKLTPKKADEQQEEWEQREWELRLKSLPSKICTGILKFHAITMLMRCYEFVAEKFVDEFTVDRLTMDPFDAALRASKTKRYPPPTKSEMRSEMYSTCLWANIIAFMADYSVHQVILAYTYYRYYQSKRKRRKPSSDVADLDDDLGAPLMLSFLTKSTSLVISRAMGLIAAAIGGAWGSTIYPGWGTLVGSQFCDGVVASVFDELQPAVMKVQP